ncbi:MAG TPA: GNAT family N-acetyltransferase [Kofleriaceae bacterium]|nr:GNAT family N-acetyltransferase [Kofleriaceae bacterium]
MNVERVTEVDAELVAAFAHLVPQLSSAPPPGEDELRAIVAAPGSILLIARDAERIVGATALTVYRIPTGCHARIDDVVVDGAARGRGIGEALTREAIRLAREAGAKAVHLTSHPSREAANRLYERMGFARRHTNVYRFDLTH